MRIITLKYSDLLLWFDMLQSFFHSAHVCFINKIQPVAAQWCQMYTCVLHYKSLYIQDFVIFGRILGAGWRGWRAELAQLLAKFSRTQTRSQCKTSVCG